MNLADLVSEYFRNDTTSKKKSFLNFINNNQQKYSRNNETGHITGSCWIVNRELNKVLLTHHKKMNIWVQPGGHSEGESDPLDIAIREGYEETGLKLKLLSESPFYLDIFNIKEHKGVKKHLHFDFTYIFTTVESDDFIVSDESHNLKWVDLKEIEMYTNEENILNMAKNTRMINFGK